MKIASMHSKYVALVVVPVIPILLSYVVKKHYKKKLKKLYEDDSKDCNELISVTYENEACRKHLMQSYSCGPTCSYEYLCHLISVFDSATSAIDMCIYQITRREIFDALINASKRGVSVRIVTDLEMAGSTGSQIKYLLAAGVGVKASQKPGHLFHHKFGIVDAGLEGKEKLFYGTLNLTLQAFSSNFDVIIFSTCNKQIQRFHEEFLQLWSNLPCITN